MNRKAENIVLIGMAGTGKTTIGQALAQRLGWAFVDSDHVLVAKAGMSIPEVFAHKGEPYFRELESRVIAEIMAQTSQVVATGGGAVLAEANRKAMSDGGLVVALTASAETIIGRVTGDANRPLMKGNPAVEVPLLMERRKHAYDFADVRVETDGRSVQDIAQQIIGLLPEAD